MQSDLTEVKQTTSKILEAFNQTPSKKEMMEMIESVVKDTQTKDQGVQLKTPATKRKKRDTNSGRPPISTAKKAKRQAIPGVEKHAMRQSEDAKKFADLKKREGRIIAGARNK